MKKQTPKEKLSHSDPHSVSMHLHAHLHQHLLPCNELHDHLQTHTNRAESSFRPPGGHHTPLGTKCQQNPHCTVTAWRTPPYRHAPPLIVATATIFGPYRLAAHPALPGAIPIAHCYRLAFFSGLKRPQTYHTSFSYQS
ncbi:hypothetical protein DEO72_LG9g1077 [Vigna unguiculata]|uniref:Uncharacterized protein n=1 Tax=Vigna unguiculata TaxID=3917 RepID=A0A4D6MYF4_VIGUN|nr:hypothetical protein DEO72_LG9g1077 [Vigna unguiculata]